MGIRYYAYPVAAELIAHARDDPYQFMSADPLMDAWGPAEDRPRMLYLDKCWSTLQDLTDGGPGGQPRPAYRLFEGDVTFVDGGMAWYAWTRVLDPDEVDKIADDIVMLTDADIRAMLLSGRRVRGPGGDDFAYISHHLACAQEFVVGLSRDRLGMVYKIG